jgi:hypothetical protein
MPPVQTYSAMGDLPARLGTPTAASVSTTAGSTGVRLRTRFVDREITATEVMIIEPLDRGLGILVCRHLDKREPPRAPGGHIAHQIHGVDGADARKQCLKILVARVVRKVANVEFSRHGVLFSLRSATAEHSDIVMRIRTDP